MIVVGSCDFGDHFLLRDHARLIFLHQKTVQRDHAVFGAGLNVRVDAERFVVADQRAIEGVLIMISKTATRPGLSMRGQSNCEITACNTVES